MSSIDMKSCVKNCVKSFAPKSMPELSEALGELTPDSKIISGGTDLVIALNQRLYEPDALLYLGCIDGLSDIAETSEGIKIGAMATMADLAKCELLTGPYAALRHAAADVGSVQIRSTATIGGNIANASPAGDIAPVLFLLDAFAIVAGKSNTRNVPIQSLLTGSGNTSLAYNEVITGFILPDKWSRTVKSAFYKLGYRKALTVSRISLAMLLDFDSDGFITLADVVAGAISPVPVFVKKAGQLMVGRKLGANLAMEVGNDVGKNLSELILEITPEEFDRDYKAKAAFGIANDIFERLCKS